MYGFCGYAGNSVINDNNKVLYSMGEKITSKLKMNFSQSDTYNLCCKGQKFIEKDNYIIIGSCNNLEYILEKYISYGITCTNFINDYFSFCIIDNNEKKVILFRDHLGIYPMFYTIKNNSIIFSTEIKCILQHEYVNAVIDKDGISQLFGFGPARIPGKCVFKDIYEVLPGSYLIYNINEDTFVQKQYWRLIDNKYNESIDETINNVKNILNNSIQSKLNGSCATMLSGGIDSSIITKEAYNKYGKCLHTFSVDYLSNDLYFKSNEYQPDSDNKYINFMIDKYEFNHEYIVIQSNDLIIGLHEAMVARDLPGMADIDVSLLIFLKEIAKREIDTVLSGEFADEIFGGYPWFHNDTMQLHTFPWSRNIICRNGIIKKEYNIDLNDFIDKEYENFNNMNVIDDPIKRIMKSNIYWFGATLISRSICMSMQANINIQMPFANYKLVEYLWNIPWDIKSLNNREKGLLREIYKTELPYEIAFRKKSPYPKTFDPKYTDELRYILVDILNDITEPINEIIDREEVLKIIKNLDENFNNPWFGQLMSGPQFIAYLIQVNMWLKEYNVFIEKE